MALGPQGRLLEYRSPHLYSAILAETQITDADGTSLSLHAADRKKELLAVLEPVGLESYKPMQDLYAVWIELGPGQSADDRKKAFCELYGHKEMGYLHSAACVLK